MNSEDVNFLRKVNKKALKKVVNHEQDLREENIRQELNKEQRDLWKKIILLDVSILGIVVPVIYSQEHLMFFPKIGYFVFSLNLLFGLFLLWVDNNKRLFMLAFREIINDEFDDIINGISDDKIRDLFELFKIEKMYGFNKHIKEFPLVDNYLKDYEKEEKKLQKILSQYWPKHHFYETSFMRFLYLIEPKVIFVFYISFIAGIILIGVNFLYG